MVIKREESYSHLDPKERISSQGFLEGAAATIVLGLSDEGLINRSGLALEMRPAFEPDKRVQITLIAEPRGLLELLVNTLGIILPEDDVDMLMEDIATRIKHAKENGLKPMVTIADRKPLDELREEKR